MGMSWTDRLEAVKPYVYDLEGNVAARDGVKRVPGCYNLREATKFIRTEDSAPQESALVLVASVLDRSMTGLQTQELSSTTREVSRKTSDVDWQAVWAYAVGPEVELASSLRSSLESTNVSVVTACAKALHAFLSCSANEAIFDLQEGIWPGNKSAFTAPVFRRQTKQEEGNIGGARWKYCVSASDLYPVTQTLNPLSDTEEDKESAGDEATITSKDVAAGLIRMGVLTRIQYILEIEQLKAADESLLSVVIALARHSPAAAKVVMKCPRLMDSIIQRFLLTDEDLNHGLRPAHTKAIQLLKILSQASTANCIRFAETGALQVAQCELYKQGFPLPSQSRLDEESFEGICATIVECLRLWRVCVNNQIGIALFPDIYPALCYWLAPLSVEKISSKDSHNILSLAQESYSLLERLAWTLPILHIQSSVHENWAWSVAVPLVETAFGWLSKDHIAAVGKEMSILALESGPDSQYNEHTFRMKLVGTMASVFHFLATVCEMFTESGSDQVGTDGPCNKSLHPLVQKLAAALVSNGFLTYKLRNCNPKQSPNSLVEILCFLWNKVADEETAMAVVSCLHGLLRLISIIDQLYQKLEEKNALMVEDCEVREILAKGLVSAADGELRDLLSIFGKEMITNKDLMQSVEAGGIAILAPGLGIGWGQSGGGVWSKHSLHIKGVARLVTELLEILPLKSESKNKKAIVANHDSMTTDLLRRINCCLAIVAIAGPGDGDMIHRICSNVLLHPDTLALLLQRLSATRYVSDSLQVTTRSTIRNGSHPPAANDTNRVYDDISKILLEHYRKVWLCGKPVKSSHGRRSTKKNVQLKSSLIATKLSTLSEESAKLSEEKVGVEGLANDMVAEWAKQRLPLPSHWVFSPMGINLTGLVNGNQGYSPECKVLADGKFAISQDKQIEMEDSVKCGLVWLQGLEALSQSGLAIETNVLSTISAVRKVHALSSLFILGDDMYLDKYVKDCINGLQMLLGRLLDTVPPDSSSQILDFEGEIDKNYGTIVDNLVHRFSSAASNDAGFARQVALYLRQDVAASIRLQTWQSLTTAQSLKRLPPLADCFGDPRRYLFPCEKNPEVIEVLVSAWTSGAINDVDLQGSMASVLVLHHIVGFLFKEGLAAGKDSIRRSVKKLLDSSSHRAQQEDILRKLVECSLSFPAEALGIEEIERRLSILQAVCDVDTSLVSAVN